MDGGNGSSGSGVCVVALETGVEAPSPDQLLRPEGCVLNAAAAAPAGALGSGSRLPAPDVGAEGGWVVLRPSRSLASSRVQQQQMTRRPQPMGLSLLQAPGSSPVPCGGWERSAQAAGCHRVCGGPRHRGPALALSGPVGAPQLTQMPPPTSGACLSLPPLPVSWGFW